MFEIPKNPADFTPEALARLIGEAKAEYDTVFAAASADGGVNVTDEQLGTLEGLLGFTTAAASHLESLTAAAGGEDAHPRPTGEGAPGIADVAAKSGANDEPNANTAVTGPYLVASAGSHGHTAGERMTFEEAGRILADQLASVSSGTGKISMPLCVAKRPETEFQVTGSRSDVEIINAACDESRLAGGSLTAAAGWCAPSPTDYNVQFVGEVYDMPDFPTVQAPRGGVYVMPELDFTTVYGGYTGTSFFNLTEAQVIAGTTKTFVEMGCPTPAESRLGVAGFGIVGNLLQLRAFPEYCEQFVRGIGVAFEHFLAVQQIAAVSTGSTQVDLTAAYPWVSDGSFWSQLYAAVSMAARDIRTLKRFKNRGLEVLLPNWVPDQVRADLIRRPASLGNPPYTDAEIVAEFAKLGIRVQFVAGYQDAFAGAGTGVGQATPLTALPNTLKFIIYPVGTWVRAELDVVKVSTVYDATRLASNQRIEGFQETGYKMFKRLSTSREYEIDFCPNGRVGQEHEIKCAA